MKNKLLAVILAAWSGTVCAEIVVGVSATTTGPGASLGAYVANAVAILPQEIAGEKIRYVMLDDGSDPTAGARNLRKLASEDKVDVIIGSTTVPVAIAQSGVANEEKVAVISLAPIPIDAAKQPYTFSVPQPITLIVDALLEHMQNNDVKRLGFIGFNDSWGDMNLNAARKGEENFDLEIISNERFGRNDTSVNAQMLKIVTAQPDAIFVGAAGTPSALPQLAAKDRGYTQQMYQNHGVVNLDFIRVAGDSAEGVIAPTGAVVVAEQLPDDHPLKAPGLEFLEQYEGKYGTGNRNAFAAYAWDASLIIQAAIPEALKVAKPGTPEFRDAMRDAIENTHELKGAHAVYTMSPTDHSGVDERARVLVTVKDGEWKLLQ